MKEIIKIILLFLLFTTIIKSDETTTTTTTNEQPFIPTADKVIMIETEDPIMYQNNPETPANVPPIPATDPRPATDWIPATQLHNFAQRDVAIEYPILLIDEEPTTNNEQPFIPTADKVIMIETDDPIMYQNNPETPANIPPIPATDPRPATDWIPATQLHDFTLRDVVIVDPILLIVDEITTTTATTNEQSTAYKVIMIETDYPIMYQNNPETPANVPPIPATDPRPATDWIPATQLHDFAQRDVAIESPILLIDEEPKTTNEQPFIPTADKVIMIETDDPIMYQNNPETPANIPPIPATDPRPATDWIPATQLHDFTQRDLISDTIENSFVLIADGFLKIEFFYFPANQSTEINSFFITINGTSNSSLSNSYSSSNFTPYILFTNQSVIYSSFYWENLENDNYSIEISVKYSSDNSTSPVLLRYQLNSEIHQLCSQETFAAFFSLEIYSIVPLLDQYNFLRTSFSVIC